MGPIPSPPLRDFPATQLVEKRWTTPLVGLISEVLQIVDQFLQCFSESSKLNSIAVAMRCAACTTVRASVSPGLFTHRFLPERYCR